MKGLPPSLRSRKRYIAFKLLCEKRVDGKMLYKALLDSMLSLFGECNTAGSNIKLEEFDGFRGIIKCNRDALSKVIIAFTLINKVDNLEIVPLTVGVSGTIRKCRKKFMEV